MNSTQFRRLLAKQTTRKSTDALLRARFRHDRGGFLRYCLPAVFDAPFDAFHMAVLRSPKLHWRDQLHNEKRLNLAPRGDGKSTVKKGDVAHSIAYGLRRFIVVICATRDDAKSWALALQDWFRIRSESTGHLHDLYGPFLVTGEKQLFTVTGPRGQTTILCTSVNASVQGANVHTHRPDETILDDWEDRKRVNSLTVRQGWKRKLKEEIGKLGDRRRGMVVEANVTINHSDSPSACIRRAEDGFRGWTVHEFKAIIDWPTPEAQKLWEQCGRVFLNLAMGDTDKRYRLAKRFYEANRARMDEGARVLNPDMLPLFSCYVMIWEEGLAAFLREMQHVENVNLDGLFNSARFTRCRVEWDAAHGEPIIVNGMDGRRIRLSEMVKRLVRWDWAGGTATGDYPALACILRDAFGYGYVVDGWMKRVGTTGQLAAAWAMCERWGVTHLSIETNQGQRILADETWPTSRQQRLDKDLWAMAVGHSEPSTGNKESELAALEPATNGGILQFADGLIPEGLAQFDAFDGIANSHHDDFHDAVARGWQRTGGMPPRMGQARVWN